jgi:cytochrome P450
MNGGLQLLFSGDPSLALDPYPLHARLREEAPVLRYDALSTVVSRHRLGKSILRDSRTFKAVEDRAETFENRLELLTEADLDRYSRFRTYERSIIDHMNGETHRRARTAAQRAFTSRRIAEMRVTVTKLVEELLDDLVARGPQVDFMNFAYRLPLLVVMEMIGAPYEDADMIKRWGDATTIIGGESPLRPETVRECDEALVEFRDYVHGLIERHRAGGARTALVAGLLEAASGGQLSEDELVALYMIILNAGHETTTNLLGNGLYALLTHRDQWEMLCRDRSIVDGAVEELMRFDSVAQFIRREVVGDREIGGVEVPTGTYVLVNVSAANRDPEAFGAPDDLDLAREPNDHLGFGYGTHFCLGANVARLEAQLAFEAIARRLPEIDLLLEPQDRRYGKHFSIRGLKSLPVDLGTAA